MHIEGGHSHILYLTASCERSTYVLILAHEGRLRRRSRRWSEEWHPAAAARNRSPLGLGTRPPATTAGVRGVRCTRSGCSVRGVKSARPAQNRHGGAPRAEQLPRNARAPNATRS